MLIHLISLIDCFGPAVLMISIAIIVIKFITEEFTVRQVTLRTIIKDFALILISFCILDCTKLNTASYEEVNSKSFEYTARDYTPVHEISISEKQFHIILEGLGDLSMEPYIDEIKTALNKLKLDDLLNKKQLYKSLSYCRNVYDILLDETDDVLVIKCKALPPIHKISVKSYNPITKFLCNSVIKDIGFKCSKERPMYLKPEHMSTLKESLKKVALLKTKWLGAGDGWFGLEDKIYVNIKPHKRLKGQNELVINYHKSKLPQLQAVNILGSEAINKRVLLAHIKSNVVGENFGIIPQRFRSLTSGQIDKDILSFYKSRGFIDAQIIQHHTFISPAKKIIYTVKLQEGDLYRINTPTLTDLSHLSKAGTYKPFSPQEYQYILENISTLKLPLNSRDQDAIGSVIANIQHKMDYVGERLYSNINVIFTVDDKNKELHTDFQINPGFSNVTVNKLEIEGLNCHLNRLISFADLFDKGVISVKKITNAQQIIRRTFSGVEDCSFYVHLDEDSNKGDVFFNVANKVQADANVPQDRVTFTTDINRGSYLHRLNLKHSFLDLANTGMDFKFSLQIGKYQGSLGSLFKILASLEKDNVISKVVDIGLSTDVSVPNKFFKALPIKVSSSFDNKGGSFSVTQLIPILQLNHFAQVGCIRSISNVQEKVMISRIVDRSGEKIHNLIPPTATNIMLVYTIPNLFQVDNKIPTRGSSKDLYLNFNKEAAAFKTDWKSFRLLNEESLICKTSLNVEHLLPTGLSKAPIHFNNLGMLQNSNCVSKSSLRPGALFKIPGAESISNLEEEEIFSLGTSNLNLSLTLIIPYGSDIYNLSSKNLYFASCLEFSLSNLNQGLFKKITNSTDFKEEIPWACLWSFYSHFDIVGMGVNLGVVLDCGYDFRKHHTASRFSLVFFGGSVLE